MCTLSTSTGVLSKQTNTNGLNYHIIVLGFYSVSRLLKRVEQKTFEIPKQHLIQRLKNREYLSHNSYSVQDVIVKHCELARAD